MEQKKNNKRIHSIFSNRVVALITHQQVLEKHKLKKWKKSIKLNTKNRSARARNLVWKTRAQCVRQTSLQRMKPSTDVWYGHLGEISMVSRFNNVSPSLSQIKNCYHGERTSWSETLPTMKLLEFHVRLKSYFTHKHFWIKNNNCKYSNCRDRQSWIICYIALTKYENVWGNYT